MNESKSINSIETENLIKLREALKTLRNTEILAGETLIELDQQGKKINNSKENIKNINAETDKSNSLLNRMLRWFRN